MIESFTHKGLKELFETGVTKRIRPDSVQRCSDRLEILDAASSLESLNLSGYQFHPLHTRPVRHSIHVNGPWCITFRWDAGRVLKVDLEQYH